MEEVERRANKSLVLVTGVTGYVGGRLVPHLLEQGYRVRVLLRGNAARLNGRSWKDQVEIALGDVLVPSSLTAAMQGINVAYYLIHSMGGHTEFSTRDIQAAENFAAAAANAGVEKIIYLGGLGDPNSNLSKHLQSRQQTGDALRQFEVPVTGIDCDDAVALLQAPAEGSAPRSSIVRALLAVRASSSSGARDERLRTPFCNVVSR